MATVSRSCTLVFLGLVWAAHAGSQEAPQKTEIEGRLRITTFETDDGQIIVKMPAHTTAGRVSGTVVAVPKGKTEEEQQRNRGKLSGYVVEYEGKRTRVGERVVAAVATAGLSYLVVHNVRGDRVGSSPIPVQAPPDIKRPATPTSGDIRLPHIGPAGNPVSVSGPVFDGDLTNGKVRIGGEDATPVAETEWESIVETPSEITGNTEIQVEENGVVAKGPYRSVGQTLTIGKTVLQPGESTTLTNTVRGLEGLSEPLPVTLVNHHPHIVSLEGGPVHVATIRPENVSAEGTVVLASTVTGIQPLGRFDISSTLMMQDPPRIPFGGGSWPQTPGGVYVPPGTPPAGPGVWTRPIGGPAGAAVGLLVWAGVGYLIYEGVDGLFKLNDKWETAEEMGRSKAGDPQGFEKWKELKEQNKAAEEKLKDNFWYKAGDFFGIW